VVFLYDIYKVIANSRNFWGRIGYEVIDLKEVQWHSDGIWGLCLKGMNCLITPEESMP